MKVEKSMAGPIRVLLADDHPLVRTGLRATLTTEPNIALVGEVADSYDIQRLCQELEPDLLLLDVRMPGPPAPQTVAYLQAHAPSVRVLVLSAYDDDVYVHSLVAAGAAGYVLKDEAREVLIHAIHSVIQGGAWFSRSVVTKLIKPAVLDKAEQLSLSDRERAILRLLAQGWDNTRIAARLNLADQTVRNYVSNLYSKLGVNSRAEARAWAREHGLDHASS